MNKVYFNQADKRWANHPYTSPSHPKATIKSGGCGATSAAMIVSSFKQTIYPNQMGDIFKANGLRANEGTDPRAFLWIGQKYGIKVKQTIYIKDAVECLQKGGMVVAYCRAGGLFSTGGHIIVLADIRGDNLVVYDPYLYKNKFANGKRKCVSVNGIEAIVSVENFKKYCNYTLYCYENEKQPTTSKYENGSYVEVDIPVAMTGATEGNDVLVDDGTNQFWVHKTVINDKSHIYARALVCYSSEDNYIIQIFNRQFWCKEKNIVKGL